MGQSLQPGSQHTAGRQTQTHGLCLASGFNTEERQPCNSNSGALHLIPQRQQQPGLFSLQFFQLNLQPGSSASSMEQKKPLGLAHGVPSTGNVVPTQEDAATVHCFYKCHGLWQKPPLSGDFLQISMFQVGD